MTAPARFLALTIAFALAGCSGGSRGPTGPDLPEPPAGPQPQPQPQPQPAPQPGVQGSYLLERIPRSDDVLSEEGASRTTGAARTWVIDPLDGTINFLHGLPNWCVSIGVVENGALIESRPRRRVGRRDATVQTESR